MRTRLYYGSIILLALSCLPVFAKEEVSPEQSPAWLVNVENSLAYHEITCSGALIDRLWVLTIEECARVPQGTSIHDSIKIKQRLGNDDLAYDGPDIAAVIPDPTGNLTLLRLSKEMEGVTPVPLALGDAAPDHSLTGWQVLYLLRGKTTIAPRLVDLMLYHEASTPMSEKGCREFMPHRQDLICTTPDDGSVIVSNGIRGAALLDSKRALSGLGSPNLLSDHIPQTRGHDIFLSIDSYRDFIIDTISSNSTEAND